MPKKHHLVFGGSRGMGKEMVNTLCKLDKVSLFGRNLKTAGIGKDVNIFESDFTDIDRVVELLAAAVKKNGKIDSVIFLQRFRGEDPELNNNFYISVQFAQKIIDESLGKKYFKTHKQTNSVIFISSVADTYIAPEQPLGYHIGKAGVAQMTKYFAFNLAAHNIRVNCISPCVVMKKEARAYYKKNPKLNDLFKKHIPLKRMGEAADIINLVQFLSSNAASYITGQNIVVDGGLTLQTHESLIKAFN
ncbi:MAG: SDR family oxidoreductase [Sediminibacterium sp.]